MPETTNFDGDGISLPPDGLYSRAADGTLMQLSFANLAANRKLVGGVANITGTGTITIGTHGLTAITAVQATLAANASLAAFAATVSVSGTTITLKVWKPTEATDCTPIAATAAASVHWLACGT